MPDQAPLRVSPSPVAGVDAPGARHDRARLVAFVSDTETEAVLREALNEALPGGGDYHRGNITHAITALRRMPSPVTLIVDLTGVDSPLAALAQLSEVVEPHIQVMVIGEVDTLDFYRQITRGLGVAEYLPKKLTRDAVRRHFVPLLVDAAVPATNAAVGRVITVTGSRGGVGTTTIAANLAWYFGVRAARHTVLFDPDLHFGSAAMLLDCPTGPGLRIALEAPERVDALFVERAAQPVAERLHVLAGEIRPSEPIPQAAGGAQSLLAALRSRYGVIVTDLPLRPVPLFHEIFDQADQRILVMVPTLASVRDTRRLLAMPTGPRQDGHGLVVLNRQGLRGGLTKVQVEEALGAKVDLEIPDMPRLVETSASMGQVLADSRNPFARGIAELARQSAFVVLLDSPLGAQIDRRKRPRWRLWA